MATIKIMQGDERDIYIGLKQSGITIKPSIVDDIEICIGADIRKTYQSGSVFFDSKELKWYIRLSQEETLSLAEGLHQAIARIKYSGAPQSDVIGVKLGSIIVMGTTSKEVL